MQSIQQSTDKLLGVMLAVTWELRSKIANNFLKFPRRDIRLFACPHFSDKFGIAASDVTATAQRIIRVDILQKPVSHKIFGKLPSVAQTLDTSVHVTSIPKIS